MAMLSGDCANMLSRPRTFVAARFRRALAEIFAAFFDLLKRANFQKK